MKRISLLLLAAALLAGCRGRRERAPKAGKAPTPARAAAAPAAERPVCPVCGGTGLCPRCADERPCLLCDGDGRCALCGGDGIFRGKTCPACNGNGVCKECGGDGRVSRGDAAESGKLPGECPLCTEGSGICPECGGAGTLPGGRTCALCGGGRWCPECRGDGRDPLCQGTGVCPACRGTGSLAPEAAPPPFLLHLTTGESIRGRLLSPPDDTVAIEHVEDGKPVREAILERRVRPLDVVLALRRFLSPGDAAAHERIAEYALRKGNALLFLADLELREAKRIEPSASRIDDTLLLVSRRRAEHFAAEAEAAFGRADDRRAWTLANLALSLDRTSSRRVAMLKLRDAAKARLVAADEGLSGELRARKRQAQHDRLLRAVRRAEGWRARAERILSRPSPSLSEVERAQRAAFEAWRGALAAANRAPEAADRETALGEGRAALGARVLAVTALARLYLKADRSELARASAARALALDPESEVAKRVNAVIAARQAREAAGERGER